MERAQNLNDRTVEGALNSQPMKMKQSGPRRWYGESPLHPSRNHSRRNKERGAGEQVSDQQCSLSADFGEMANHLELGRGIAAPLVFLLGQVVATAAALLVSHDRSRRRTTEQGEIPATTAKASQENWWRRVVAKQRYRRRVDLIVGATADNRSA